MNDQEKSNFLKAKLLADKGLADKGKTKPIDVSETDISKVASGLNSVIKFIGHFIYFLSLYATQYILLTRYSIIPFTFLESGAIFYAGIKSITMVGRFFLAFKS